MISVSGEKVGGQYFIRPCPLITIQQQNNRTNSVRFGNTYNITLRGKLLVDKGSPFGSSEEVNNVPSWYTGSNYVEYSNGAFTEYGPLRSPVNPDRRLGVMLAKQRGIREAFASDGLLLSVYHSHDTGANPSFSCYCNVESIQFDEGPWVNTCDYTIQLTTYLIFFNHEGPPSYPASLSSFHPDSPALGFSPTSYDFLHGNINDYDSAGYISGAYIEDFSEDWSFEEDDRYLSVDDGGFIKAPAFRVTRNTSATGRTAFLNDKAINGWVIAKDFVRNYLSNGTNSLPRDSMLDFYLAPGVHGGEGFFSQVLSSGDLFNHAVTENFSVTEGTYSLSETFIVCSGGSASGAMESYELSVGTDHQDPFVSVSINGDIQGLTENLPDQFSTQDNKFDEAMKHWGKISGSGLFGVNSPIYKRANSSVGVALNAQPKNISVGLNKKDGIINYSLDFDNRPTNFISGVSYENVTINDTYPGDVYATIPVIGRKTGPIFQAMGTRTEYRRDVSIEVILDYTDTYYPTGHPEAAHFAMLKKPILREPYRTQFTEFISGVSPISEPGVRKYFLNPTTETWSPKEGRYSLNLSWVYELDR